MRLWTLNRCVKFRFEIQSQCWENCKKIYGWHQTRRHSGVLISSPFTPITTSQVSLLECLHDYIHILLSTCTSTYSLQYGMQCTMRVLLKYSFQRSSLLDFYVARVATVQVITAVTSRVRPWLCELSFFTTWVLCRVSYRKLEYVTETGSSY